MNASIFRKKSLASLLRDAQASPLKKTLGVFELTMLGIGAIIGTGIFVLTGEAAAGTEHAMGAGPALTLSFVITGLACAFAALCYAELASMIPVSGSAYTYSYHSFGEWVAWIIGWDLVLEYAVGNVAVAIGWAGYFKNLLDGFGLYLPGWLSAATGTEMVFFAYVGFDAISTTAEEAKNPQRDLPRGMILALVICTVLYIVVAAVLTGMVPLLAGTVGIGAAAELTKIGTLFAFILVAIGVFLLRRSAPEVPRKFRTPAYVFVCGMCVLICFVLMLALPLVTWLRFGGWLALGAVVYFFYGYRNSTLNQSENLV